MPYITTQDGAEIFYNDWGTGSPVILIHGWPLNGDMWEHQATFLALNGYRVIAYDRRGFGRSSQTFNGHDYNTLASDLNDLMNKLDLRDAALVGFSMGGGEVIRYLSRYGSSRVSRAALIASSVPYMIKDDSNPDGVPGENFDEFRKQVTEDRPNFLNGFGPKFYGRTLIKHSVSEPWLQWTFNMAMMASLKATRDDIGAFSSTDFREEMKAITTPFLIVHGTDDATVPHKLGGDVSAKLLPNNTYLQYEGEPHGLFATAPDRLNNDLLNFLGGDRNVVPHFTTL